MPKAASSDDDLVARATTAYSRRCRLDGAICRQPGSRVSACVEIKCQRYVVLANGRGSYPEDVLAVYRVGKDGGIRFVPCADWPWRSTK